MGQPEWRTAPNYKITQLQNYPISFHHSPLRNPDIVAGSVLHQIHHLVGLPDNVVRVARVERISGQPNRSSHIQVPTFVSANTPPPLLTAPALDPTPILALPPSL